MLVGPAETALPTYLQQKFPFRFFTKQIEWTSMRPAHSLLSGNSYRMGKTNYISMSASRGCPYKCEFCGVHNMFGRRMEYRDIDDVIAEIKQNYIDKDVRIFNFEDDNISANKSWFKRFLECVAADSLLQDIELTALNGLCYPSLDGPLLKLMRKAGFRQLHLSYVTQNKSLRQQLHRPEEKEKLENIVKAALKMDFFLTIYIIIGLPGQSYEEVKNSIDYLLSLNVLVGPSVFYIPPASALYDNLNISDSVRGNWNLYRSSAFAVQTDELNREQLMQLFSYARQQNLLRKK